MNRCHFSNGPVKWKDVIARLASGLKMPMVKIPGQWATDGRLVPFQDNTERS